MAKEISQMTAGEINKALDRASAERTKLDDALIAAGRGHERVLETYEKDDPLSIKFRANVDRHRALRREIERRYGPADLEEALAYARERSCIWLMFDADAEINPALPSWEW